MARPQIDPAEKRTQTIGVRLSPNEIVRVTELADAAGLTVAGFMRSAALKHRVTVVQSIAPDFDMRDQVRRIGVNLNQIARVLNAGGEVEPPDLSQALADLDMLFKRWIDDDAADR